MIARRVGYVLGSVVDVLVRSGFGCVGWLAVKAQPASSYQDGADWLTDVEAETEVLGPADFVGCDCPSRQAADLDDHAPDCGARAAQETMAMLQDAMWCASHKTLFGWCKHRHDERAAELLDHIEALLEFHRAGIDSREGMHCHCGTWVLNEANLRAHQARVVAAMVEADQRIAERRKAQK